MAVGFVDTNVFVRHFTNDDPDQAERAGRIFAEVEAGTRRVTTSEAILAEVVYVLTSKTLYKASRGQVRQLLAPILGLRGFRLRNKRSYLEALDLFVEKRTLSFADALAVAHARHAGAQIVSFDKSFDRITGVTREEP